MVLLQLEVVGMNNNTTHLENSKYSKKILLSLISNLQGKPHCSGNLHNMNIMLHALNFNLAKFYFKSMKFDSLSGEN